MARKIPLKVTCLSVNDDQGKPLSFSWAEQMQHILRQGPQQGLNFDDVVRSVEAMAPITKAVEEAADCVTLTDDQWKTLRTRLDAFGFRIADPALVEFGLAIRNAPEIT